MISNESRNQMKEAWINAVSIESYEGDISDLEEAGRQQSKVQKEKEYIFYRDKNDNFWYRAEFLTDHGRLSEYEYIFGKKPKRRRNKTS